MNASPSSLTDHSLAQILQNDIGRGAKSLGLDLSPVQTDLLTRYVLLLNKWNKAYNLTAIRDPREMVFRHIVDSLSIVPHISGEAILDVGSGPGLPGVVLAIMYPDKQFTTLDSNGKKTRFMLQAKLDLQLNNLAVANSRVESFQVDVPFDAITSRAFSSLVNMVDGTKHLLSPSGVYLAMKGLYPEEELKELMDRHEIELVGCEPLKVPGTDGDRHLVILRNRH
ncbi:16S rRNA (guanine(527)-N(7))-methyltransferase RsmG [Endozoicomonas sp. GU-1]|uniref:16S rRNA (guanine(527)-N(7))-methyltransferase RsmG n=1 Tax=Endozoicomonas sp. GU-1 TaxID=3009078 RepID=UPI0022B4E0B0|nr:16S rRNA (guanine(527)-N(7))-methyltransferase RsmG [Endozoicomonas sp. GU-1]WBA81776.1 16S rRNA (guanine(527)-N(7))-methyltransferase RsmG [Endozoicomonas sp. GU-1]WBA84731.1 16S rRNA (guanine(527)-N(7))-methyltransferase RsmG [Endozoicomonas sp. GU-1]